MRLPGHRHTSKLWLNLLLDARWSWRLLKRLPDADVVVTNSILLPALASRGKRRAGKVVVSLNRMPKGQLRAYAAVSRIQVPSTAVLEAALREAPNLRSRMLVVPNTIACDPLRKSRGNRCATDVIKVGYIGRIHPEKGLLLLAEAARRLGDMPGLPPWRLLLKGPLDVPRGGGGDDFAATIRAIAPDLFARGIMALEPPEFDAPALARAYGDLDVFVYPSLASTGETFGVAVAEAMAAGAACVVSDLPCFADLVTPEVSGLVFDRSAQDPADALASTLARLIRDSTLRARLSAAAQPIADRCDVASVADSMLDDFSKLTASR